MGDVTNKALIRPCSETDDVGVETLETVTLVVFTVLTVALNIPQAMRLWATRDASGLSIAGLLSGTVGYMAWVAYLSVQHQWIAATATAVATLLWVGITGFAVSRRGVAHTQVAHMVSYAVVLSGLAWVDVRLFGVALSLGVAWTTVPSVWEAWRAERITGLSVPSWTLYAAESLSWLAWALMIEDRVLMLYGLLATTFGAAVLAAVVVRKDARHPAGTEALSELTHGMHVSDVEAEPSVVAAPVNPLPRDDSDHSDNSDNSDADDVLLTPVTPLTIAVAASV